MAARFHTIVRPVPGEVAGVAETPSVNKQLRTADTNRKVGAVLMSVAATTEGAYLKEAPLRIWSPTIS
jgi:hypothetical protein